MIQRLSDNLAYYFNRDAAGKELANENYNPRHVPVTQQTVLYSRYVEWQADCFYWDDPKNWQCLEFLDRPAARKATKPKVWDVPCGE